MSKKLVVVIVIIISAYIVLGLFKQIFNALDAGKRLDDAAYQVATLQQKNSQLKNQLNLVSQPDYIEKIARNNLNLSKPNETIVIIPDDQVKNVIISQQPKPVVVIPNWQGWLRLFLN